MGEKQLQALANELTKNLKTPDDLNQFDRLLKKISVGAALNTTFPPFKYYFAATILIIKLIIIFQ
ncbi:hypothetical protein LU604_02180 [Erwinia tracheiphila]|nr:hypothetical protein [Erwinia tracheiphila]UIA83932.1 hypothetical protein LU604_02180 [Erwinia tracheiphila]UIA92514.1 hypothetical protein LU632_02155 [Erwinia tracheiphila]